MNLLPTLLLVLGSGLPLPTATPLRVQGQPNEPQGTPDLLEPSTPEQLLLGARRARDGGDPALARRLAREGILLLTSDSAALSLDREQLLVNLGSIAGQQGDAVHALKAFECVVHSRAARLGPDHVDVWRARQDLPGPMAQTGSRAAALTLAQEVVTALEGALDADDADLSRARMTLATLLRSAGRLEEARGLQELVLRSRERTLGPQDPGLARARLQLASTLTALGDSGAALEHFRSGLRVLEEQLPAQHPDLARFQQDYSVALSQLGREEEALDLTRRVLATFETILPPGHPSTLEARQNLGVSLKRTGDLIAARTIFQRAVVDLERTRNADDPDLRRARHNLAAALLELRDLPAARALQEEVVRACEATLPEDHPEILRARNNLAVTLRGLGLHAAALEIQGAVLAAREKGPNTDALEIAGARQNLAVTLEAMGRKDEALALTQQAVDDLGRKVDPQHLALVAARSNLASSLSSAGRLEEALPLALAARDILDRALPPDHDPRLLVRMVLAGIRCRELAAQRSFEEAAPLQGEITSLAVSLAEALQARLRTAVLDASPREAAERAASAADPLALTLSLALGAGLFVPAPESIEAAFLASESLRGAAILAAALARRGSGRSTGSQELDPLIGLSRDLARRARAGAPRAEIDAARAAIDAHCRELALQAARVLGNPRAVEPTVRDVLGELDTDSALVSWRRTPISRWKPGLQEPKVEERLVAFVARRRGAAVEDGHVVHLVDVAPMEAVQRAVEAWRSGINPGGPTRGIAADDSSPPRDGGGDVLRALILDPLRTEIGDARRIRVIVDDILHAVPLDALPAGPFGNGSPGELLGDARRIEQALFAGESLIASDVPEDAGGLLAVGDPAFAPLPTSPAALDRASIPAVLRGGAFDRGFERLPATAEEVRGIASLWSSIRGDSSSLHLFEGEQATRDALVRYAQGSRFLHVATHGWTSPWVRTLPSPEGVGSSESADASVFPVVERSRRLTPLLLCGIALAGAGTPQGPDGSVPGLVSAQEFAALDLSACELAVISACETNVGVVEAGRGAASIQQALHMAGVRSAITSLWNVPDEPTRDLMVEFYRRLWVLREPKAQALWSAKRMLRERRDGAGRARYTPTDWAGWVLTGSPR